MDKIIDKKTRDALLGAMERMKAHYQSGAVKKPPQFASTLQVCLLSTIRRGIWYRLL